MNELVEFLRARYGRAAQGARALPHAIGNLQSLWSPERLLADVDAKLRIVNEHRIIDDRCRVCTAIHDGYARRFRAPCPTLRLLALPFADHKDYREEWAL